MLTGRLVQLVERARDQGDSYRAAHGCSTCYAQSGASLGRLANFLRCPATRSRIDGRCGCDESTSCYACLRSYRNQFIHPELARGPVKDYLAQALSRL